VILLDKNIDFLYHSSAAAALDHLTTCHPENFPDLLLVDLHMPPQNGFSFIKSYESTFFSHHPKTRLIILTSSIMEADRVQAATHPSICQFFNKPILHQSFTELIHQLEQICS